MRALKSPVTQFLLVGLLTVVGLVLATGYLADRAANSEAVTEAQQSIGAVASALAPNGIRDRLLVGRAGDIDRFTRKIDPLIANSDVEHIVIWSPHGRVVYSDETRIIGERPDSAATSSASSSKVEPGRTGPEPTTPTRRRSSHQAREGSCCRPIRRSRQSAAGHCSSRATSPSTRSTRAGRRSSRPSGGS